MKDYKQCTDQDLTNFLKSDDTAAYTEIYDRYIFKLLHHINHITRDREEAKDIVHEVFARLWAKRTEIEININLSGFLYTSARNIVFNQINHKHVESKYYASILKFAEAPKIVTDHRIRESQLAAIIEKEILALPPKMREVFELSRKQYLSHKGIAERLQISEATVSRHISNALKELRVKLGLLAFLIFWLSHR